LKTNNANQSSAWAYGFLLSIFGLIIVGIHLLASMDDIRKIGDNRARARQTAFQIEHLNTLLADAETGQRGFLVTKQPRYLNSYRDSLRDIPAEIHALRNILDSQSDQLRRLQAVEGLMDAKLGELARTIALTEKHKDAEALKIVMSGEGQEYTEKIRTITAEMTDVQKRHIVEYSHQMEQILDGSNYLVFIGSALAVSLAGILLIVLNGLRRRRVADEEVLLEANHNLQHQQEVFEKVIEAQNNIATADLDRSKIMELAIKHSMELTKADAALIEIVEGDELIYKSVGGTAAPFMGLRIKIDGSFSGLCLKSNHYLICDDSETDQRVNLEACRKVNLRSMVVVPLYHGTKVMGVLKNYHSQPNHFTEESYYPLKLVAGIMSSAFGQASAFEDKISLVSELENAKIEITDSRDKAQRATEIKSRFLANMSHELRTPLNGILGIASLLQGTQLNPEQQEYARTVQTSGEALLRLVNDVLDFSKIEAGRLDFESVNFDLISTLQDIRKMFSYSANQKSVHLDLEIDENVPTYVVGDPGRFRQIFVNLVGNALKFTARGKVKIFARLESTENQMQSFYFEVQDSGIGIPKDIVKDLFHEFMQADASTTRRFGGTGLGLSISKRLAQRMSGDVGLKETNDSGTTFWIRLSMQEGHKPEAQLPVASEEIVSAVQNPLKILIAEDNPVNQMIALKMIQKLGHDGDIVENGKGVLKALHQKQYDLILMDCHMPEMDGFEATAEIRKDPLSCHRIIPIIAMTANAMKDDSSRCLAAGMDDYLAKPVPIKLLSEKLQKWTTIIEERGRKTG
jgi:signal transduction histidine kinase/ActR/RegA family two-component response regulator